jgi:hypothetical protein
MTIKKTLKMQLHEELFKEIVSYLTIGFTDQDLEPLTVEEQIIFFIRPDVILYMEQIVEEIEQWMIDNDEKMPIPGDAYRESIFDGEKNSLYQKIIVPIENDRKAIDGDSYEYKDEDFLTYNRYKMYESLNI